MLRSYSRAGVGGWWWGGGGGDTLEWVHRSTECEEESLEEGEEKHACSSF